LAGQSLGGRITILGVREFPTRFDGGLAMCPAGQEGNDIRAGIAAAAEVITGIRPRAETLDADLKRMAGILGPPAMLTDKGKQLASIQIQLSGGPRPFAVEGLQNRLMANISDGVRMEPSWINRASTNVHLRYTIDDGLGITSDELNKRMPRKQAEGNLRTRSGPYRELVPFDGNIQRPVLSIHGTGDLQTPVAQQQALRRAVLAAGTGDRLVQRLMRIPGHCQFSEPEQVAAFDDLVKWVREGVKPEGDDVMGDLSDAGRTFTNPLRPGDPGTLNVVPRGVGTR
jgi:pimeloyl-ACP methyl ester carboxylesterase